MFAFNRKPLINQEMSNYIKDQTNKSIEKYSKMYKENNFGIRVSDLVKDKSTDLNSPNCLYILPFVSFISFLVGYNFCNLIKQQ